MDKISLNEDNMQDFEKTKKSIAELFANREGFNEEIIEAITASYLYFKENYPEQIDVSNVNDYEDFVAPKGEKTTLCNIYLNRIYKNVKRIAVAEGDESSIYNDDTHEILLKDDVDKRIANYSHINDEETLKIIKKNIRAKIITHELIHAASDDGITTGFTGHNEGVNHAQYAINKPDLYKNPNAVASRMVEFMTEIIALNIVDSNSLTVRSNNKGVLFCRNPESSNYALNPIAEYFVRVYKDSVVGKFQNGFLWNNQFEEKVLKNWFPNLGIPMQRFNDYLRDITSKTPATNTISTISFFQEKMIEEYIQSLNINSNEDVFNVIKDFSAFNLFAVQKFNAENKLEVDVGLNKKLTELKNVILQKATEFGIDKETLNQTLIEEKKRLKSSNGQEIKYTLPFQNLKKSKERERVL